MKSASCNTGIPSVSPSPNSRLIACYHSSVTFRWKDYRADGRNRQKVMTLAAGEFIRRFLIDVQPRKPSNASRHYGLSPERVACSTHQWHSPGPRTHHHLQRAKAALASVSRLRRPQNHHREIPARLLGRRHRPGASTAVIGIDTS
jgi:hypothetical protein